MLNWLVFCHRPFSTASFFSRATGLLSLWLLYGRFFNRLSSVFERLSSKWTDSCKWLCLGAFSSNVTWPHVLMWLQIKAKVRTKRPLRLLHAKSAVNPPVMLAVQQLEVRLHLHLQISRKIGPLRDGQVKNLETWAWGLQVPKGQQGGCNTCLGAQSHRVPPCSGLLPRSSLWFPHPVSIPLTQHTSLSWRVMVLSSPD